VPRWGEYSLLDIKAPEVELWLGSVKRANSTRAKIWKVMSLLFNHARRHELYYEEKNPIEQARQSAKRLRVPDVLRIEEVQRLLAALPPRERTMVLLDVGTGLRQSELFGLKWQDIDFEIGTLRVTRSVVQQIVGQLQDRGIPKGNSPSRGSDCRSRRLAPADPLQGAAPLGVRQSPRRRENAVLGATADAQQHPSHCEEARHHQADRMAYLPAHLFNATLFRRCGPESDAGTAATLHGSGDAGNLHPSGYGGKTCGAEHRGLADCRELRREAIWDINAKRSAL